MPIGSRFSRFFFKSFIVVVLQTNHPFSLHASLIPVNKCRFSVSAITYSFIQNSSLPLFNIPYLKLCHKKMALCLDLQDIYNRFT